MQKCLQAAYSYGMQVCLRASELPNAELIACQQYTEPLTMLKRWCLILLQKQYLEPRFHVHYLGISQTQCKNTYCGLGIFFSVSFLSCHLFLSSSSLTYLEHQPEKASAQLLFPLGVILYDVHIKVYHTVSQSSLPVLSKSDASAVFFIYIRGTCVIY